MHPEHDIKIDDNRLQEAFPAVIEITAGSMNKYKLDKASDVLRLDRVLYGALHYPTNYGFIPGPFCADGDLLDVLVQLYNEKFVKPAKEIMSLVKSDNLLESPATFANAIEWDYWRLCHHEGRRAHMEAAMMAPAYAWWHGIYDVAHNFYFKLIPEARHYRNDKVDAYIHNLLENDPMHT